MICLCLIKHLNSVNISVHNIYDVYDLLDIESFEFYENAFCNAYVPQIKMVLLCLAVVSALGIIGVNV